MPVGAAWHALDLAEVREVVPAPTAAPVPRAPSWLVGLANLRGEIVPIVDTAGALGDEPVREPSHLVIVTTARGVAAVAATGAPRPVQLGEPSGASERRGGRGQFTLDGCVASLIDVEALVAP